MGELDDPEHSSPPDRVAGLAQRHVRGHVDHPEAAVHQHHGVVGAAGLVGVDLGVAGVVKARRVDGRLADGAGDGGVDDLSLRQLDGLDHVLEGSPALFRCHLPVPELVQRHVVQIEHVDRAALIPTLSGLVHCAHVEAQPAEPDRVLDDGRVADDEGPADCVDLLDGHRLRADLGPDAAGIAHRDGQQGSMATHSLHPSCTSGGARRGLRPRRTRPDFVTTVTPSNVPPTATPQATPGITSPRSLMAATPAARSTAVAVSPPERSIPPGLLRPTSAMARSARPARMLEGANAARVQAILGRPQDEIAPVPRVTGRPYQRVAALFIDQARGRHRHAAAAAALHQQGRLPAQGPGRRATHEEHRLAGGHRGRAHGGPGAPACGQRHREPSRAGQERVREPRSPTSAMSFRCCELTASKVIARLPSAMRPSISRREDVRTALQVGQPHVGDLDTGLPGDEHRQAGFRDRRDRIAAGLGIGHRHTADEVHSLRASPDPDRDGRVQPRRTAGPARAARSRSRGRAGP